MSSLPLHCKDVGRAIDYDAVSRLSVVDAALRDEWRHSLGWCLDASRYASVTCGPPLRARVSRDDVSRMVACRTVRRLGPGEVPRAFCSMFCVPEPHKDPPRRRRVVHPKSVNDACGRDTLRPLQLPSRAELREATLSASHVCCLDAASFFDQFGLSREVSLFFCFVDPDGKMCAQDVLPMGVRQATEVGVSLMRLVCSFPHPEVRIDIATDNLRFVGQRAQVHKAVRQFLNRCDSIGLIINEVPPGASHAAIGALIATQADFLGEVVDFTSHSVTIRAKIIDRLRALWDIKAKWTWRNAVGAVAILLWCAPPLRQNVCDHYAAMAFLRDAGRRLSGAPLRDWERPAEISSSSLDDVGSWIADTVANRPAKIPAANEVPATVIVTDASAWGWGAVCSGEFGVRTVGEPWGDSLAADLAARSTIAEPEAVWRALCRFVRRDERTSVAILTDHSPFVGAWRRGYSPAPRLNGIVARIRARFPLLQLTVSHIPGCSNPADELSRGNLP